jgi:lincosamide nucleotidyltransferase A/C/D/E
MPSLISQPEMTSGDVCDFLNLMGRYDIHIWLDGGWAVDACLGWQTRRHSDLDIVIEQGDVDVATAALERLGYGSVPRPDTRPWNFVLGDPAGHQIDFHVIVLDETGRALYGPPGTAECYPAEALAGKGTVNGRTVDCIAPEWLVRFHTGYEVDETDWADVAALCARFGIPIPPEYGRFTGAT